MALVLVCEQQSGVRRRLEEICRELGHGAVQANDRAAVLRHAEHSKPQVAVIGWAGNAEGSINLAQTLHLRCPDLPVILFVPESSEELAIAAIRAGVQDYVRQPSYEELVPAVTRCLRTQPAASLPGNWERPLVGSSAELLRIREYLSKVAASDCNVLITGETGTGKDVVAEAIHQNSPRRSRPFVVINCAAIPDHLLESELFGYERGAFTGALSASSGKFLEADGGTIFLDEIGDMSLFLQAKILRAIEAKEVQRLGAKGNRRVNVRTVAATNQNLDRLITQGRFRSDLFFRLGVTQIRLPPLRERPEDIPLLSQFFVEETNRRLGRRVEGIDAELMARLMRYSWPGNVRELKNLVESLFIAKDCGWISTEDMPHHMTQVGRGVNGECEEERTRIVRVLQSTNWNKSLAASELHWSRMTLYRKIAKYRIRNERDGHCEVAVPALARAANQF